MDCGARGDDTITNPDIEVTMKTKAPSVLSRSKHQANDQQQVCDKQSEEAARERAPKKTTAEPAPQQTAEETEAAKKAAQEAVAKKAQVIAAADKSALAAAERRKLPVDSGVATQDTSENGSAAESAAGSCSGIELDEVKGSEAGGIEGAAAEKVTQEANEASQEANEASQEAVGHEMMREDELIEYVREHQCNFCKPDISCDEDHIMLDEWIAKFGDSDESVTAFHEYDISSAEFIEFFESEKGKAMFEKITIRQAIADMVNRRYGNDSLLRRDDSDGRATYKLVDLPAETEAVKELMRTLKEPVTEVVISYRCAKSFVAELTAVSGTLYSARYLCLFGPP